MINQQYELLRERVSHGNASFPLMIYEIETDLSFKERVGCHWHDEIEIMVVTKGQAQVHINNRNYSVKEGGIIFISSNHLHSITGNSNLPFDFFAVVFNQTFLNSFVNDAVQLKYIDCLKNSEAVFPEIIFPRQDWEMEIYHLLLDIREIFAKKETAYELLIKIKLYIILYLLYTHSDKEISAGHKHADYRITLTKAVIEYIKANYENRISLPELSAKFNLSEGHLSRFFKSMTKMSIVEYSNYYRISKSLMLLKETEKDIGEIAGMTGFNNISYYNKIFKKYMHMTPSQFRQALQENETDACI